MKLYKGRAFADNYKQQVLTEFAPEQHIEDYPLFHSDMVGVPLKDLPECPLNSLTDDYGWYNDPLARPKMRKWVEQHGDIEPSMDFHRRYRMSTVRHEHPRKGWLIRNPAMFNYHPFNLERAQLWLSERKKVHSFLKFYRLYDTGLWHYPVLLTAVEDIQVGTAFKGVSKDHTLMPPSVIHPCTLGYEYVYRIVEKKKSGVRVFTGSYDKPIRVFTGNRIKALHFAERDPMLPVIFYTKEQAHHFYRQYVDSKMKKDVKGEHKKQRPSHYLRKYRLVLGKPNYINDKSDLEFYEQFKLLTENSRDIFKDDNFNYDMWMKFKARQKYMIPPKEECKKYIDELNELWDN